MKFTKMHGAGNDYIYLDARGEERDWPSLAVAMSDNFPKWLGWVAAALGLISLVVGFYQSYDGLSVEVTNYVFATVATPLTVWVLVMAILKGRKTMQTDG